MSLDEEIAQYVNLLPQETPGDMYLFIADKTWKEIDRLVNDLPANVVSQFDEVFSTLLDLQGKYESAEYGSEVKAQAWAELQEYRNNKRKLREQLFPVFWQGVTDLKERRKIVKRPSMSISYGATPYGLGQQTWDDTRPISDYLYHQEKLWSSQFGHLIYKVSREELAGPGRLLTLFESLAETFNERQEAMSWCSPITKFPVVQNYRKAVSERTKLKHGESVLDVVVESWDNTILDKDSQKLGASPNIVHSLDATHMCLVLSVVWFDVAAIHDSWGTTAGNMKDLFRVVREQFVRLYKEDPLLHILRQLKCEDRMPDRGDLDVSQILKSDFAFC